MDFKNIELTTFVNPHLFWFITKCKERCHLLTEVNNKLHSVYSKEQSKSKSKGNFHKGEIVGVEYNGKLYRGLIENIYALEEDKIEYFLWLVDYGICLDTISKVFKLPEDINTIPKLAFQASLYNVVYTTVSLEYNNVGKTIMTNKHTLHPTHYSRSESLKYIQPTVNKLEFKLEKEANGILFGDILYKNNSDSYISIKDLLIENKVLDINEEMFAEMVDFINIYKKENQMLISKICEKEPYLIENMESKRIGQTCEALISKIEKEFSFNDSMDFLEDSCRRRQLARAKLNSSISPDTSLSDMETKSKIPTEKKVLMDKLVEAPNIESTTDFSEPELKYKPPIKLSPKDLIEKRKIIFCPAGAERRNFTAERKPEKNTSVKSKQHQPNNNYSSTSSSVSDNSNDIAKQKNKRTPSSTCDTNTNYTDTSVNELQQKIRHCEKACDYNPQDDSENSFEESERPSIKINQSDAELGQFNKQSEDSSKTTNDDSENLYKTADDEQSSYQSDAKEEPCVAPVVNSLKIKPVCNCKQCNVWNKEETVTKELFPKDKKVEKIKELDMELFLLKNTEKKRDDICINSVDYAAFSKMEKQSLQMVMVHGEMIGKPFKEISQAHFHKRIYENLGHLGYKISKRIQSYVWPAIFRNQHVFMIHGPQTGKTMAYLPVICTFIVEKQERYEKLMKIAGAPIAIVLCKDTQQCEDVFDLAKVVLRDLKANITLVTYPLAHINTSHTDMLVTTAPILVDLIRNKSVNFKRLCHLVIENADYTLQKYKSAVNVILDLAQSMLKNRVVLKTVQLIVTAEHWNVQVRNLFTNLEYVPTICIGNYLEAVLYGRIEFSMKFMNSSCKQLELNQLLKDSYKFNKSIILCNEDEIQEIHDILNIKGINSIPLLTNMCREDILFYEHSWTDAKAGSYSVLICSDFVLHTLLTVTSATTLLHYSLPGSWTKFVKRFACLLENCHSPLDPKEVKIVSKTVILCDENCQDQMKKFFNYINSTDLRKQLPDKLKEFSDGLKNAQEQEKLENNIRFCDRLKVFGKCEKNHCSRRHLIDANLDISNRLPRYGKIKFKIINIIDVTSFAIQLLQHVDEHNKVHEYENKSTDISEELTAALSISKHKLQHLHPGRHCAYYDFNEEDEGKFFRCEILKVYDQDIVEINLFDKGTFLKTLSSRLYRLPDEFKCDVRPTTVIEAYLANLIPPYNDDNFSAKSFFNLQTILKNHNYQDIIFTGDVCLQLCNTLWLKDVHEKVILSDQIITGFQLSSDILKNKLAETDPQQLERLYALCNDVGINIPKENVVKKQETIRNKEKVDIQWAHLDVEQINEVTFASAHSPEEIYVRLNKFDDLLYKLHREIQESLERPNYRKLNTVQVNDVCLAKDSLTGEYNRVQITKIESNKALCFYVDYGDEATVPIDELKYVQPIFVTKLPFQCIRCRLHGVNLVSDDVLDAATDALYEYGNEPGTDIYRTLYIKVCQKECISTTTISNKTRYSVILKDGFGEKKVVINQLLIDCGLVIPNPEEVIENFDIPIRDDESLASDDDVLKETAYICKKTDEMEQSYLSRDFNEELQPNLDEMELFIIDPVKFFAQLTGGKETGTTSSERNTQLPAITAVPNVNHFTPDVYWYQTDKIIKLSIKLTDIQDYKVTLRKNRILNFKADKNDKPYCLTLILYSIVETLQHTLVGPEIRITLTKTKPIDWPRLCLSKEKNRHIHYDLTKIQIEENNEKLLELPKELDDMLDDLNDDDPMYVVESDLDSDLDEELKHDSD